MKLIIVTLTVSLLVFLYFFTSYHQTKKSLKTEKPPKRNKTPRSERSHKEKRLSEGTKSLESKSLSDGTKSPESKRLPDVVIIGVKKSGTMTLGRRERRREVNNDLRHPLSPRQVPQASPQHCGGR